MKTMTLKQRNRSRVMWAVLFIAPTLLLVLLLNIWPIIQTIYLSFNRAHGLRGATWIGLENYREAFTDPRILRSFINTASYAVVTVPVGIFLSLITAVLLNSEIKGKSFFRVIYFIPVISAPTAVALVWRWMFHSEFGIINYVLSLFNIASINWLGNPNTALSAIMVVGIWGGVGYNMVILLGGLQGISKSYYEAAKIDGANGIQQFFKIILPLISPTLFFVLTTSLIGSFQVFDLIFMMIDSGGPSITATQSIVGLFYGVTFVNNNRGYGSTIAVLILAVILAITVVQMKLQKKWVHYDQ